VLPDRKKGISLDCQRAVWRKKETIRSIKCGNLDGRMEGAAALRKKKEKKRGSEG